MPKRKLVKYKVIYLRKSLLDYGRKKTIWVEDEEFATSLKDAKEWVKVLEKERKKEKQIRKNSIRIIKLPRKEWF